MLIPYPDCTDRDDVQFTREQIAELFARSGATEKSPANRRSRARTPMGRQIQVVIKRPEAGDQTVDGWLHDLSMEGLGLVTPLPINVGARIAVSLGMPRSPVEYVVRRCGPLPHGMFTVGCMKVDQRAPKQAAPAAQAH
jgi:hypothetical protein